MRLQAFVWASGALTTDSCGGYSFLSLYNLHHNYVVQRIEGLAGEPLDPLIVVLAVYGVLWTRATR